MCPLAIDVHAFAMPYGRVTSPIFQIPSVQPTNACFSSGSKHKLRSRTEQLFHFTSSVISRRLTYIVYTSSTIAKISCNFFSFFQNMLNHSNNRISELESSLFIYFFTSYSPRSASVNASENSLDDFLQISTTSKAPAYTISSTPK